MDWNDAAFKLRMDLHEDNQQNQVTAIFELPGVSKEDIQVELHNGTLRVLAELKPSEDLDDGGYTVIERRFGKYARILGLPQDVEEDEIVASLKDGLLVITFPGPTSTAEPAPKRIPIF